MPTWIVCSADEKLIGQISLLLDIKKNSEKLEGEIKVATAQKEEKERKERRERGETTPEVQETPGAEPENVEDANVPAADGDGEKDTEVREEKPPSRAPSRARSARPQSSHKRSVSVLSA